jgi:hypothetical protein
LKIVLHGIFGPKREDLAGGWRMWLNEKLYDISFHHISLGFDSSEDVTD